MSKGDKVCIDLVGGPPWGFRLGGGADFGCPLEIAKLRNNSKATNAGLAEGDVVSRIDHQDVSSKSHGDAMKIIELAGPTLRLEIIKGVGPSADLMNVSMMSDSFTASQSEAVHQESRTSEVMYQQEPCITISKTHSPPRRASTPRTLTIVSSATTHKAEIKTAERQPPTQTDPWTVNVTSYEFANTSDPPKPQPVQPPKPEAKPQPAVAPKPQTSRASQPRVPPPTCPKPKFKATTLPRQNRSSCPTVPSWGAPPTDPALHHVNGSMGAGQVDSGLQTLPKATPMFKVAKIDAKQHKWQPTSMKDVSFDDPRHKFNTPVKEMPQTSPSNSFITHESPSQPSPSYIPAPPPPPPPHMSPRKPANHIPGMVNPLICDDSQGDFGANPIVRPDMAGGGTESRKMYSDSAFYDSPLTTYPTIQQQVALAKEISSFLESNQNKRSRGGRMFSKRKQRADEWSMDSRGQRKDIQRITTVDSFSSTGPSFSTQRKEFGYNHVRHHPDPIKSKLDAAELELIQHNQDFRCKHDELPPNIAFDINQALATSHGKAGQFFEKRKQRAEKYVVDENKRNLMSPPSSTTQINSPGRSYKSPWDAAAEGHLDAAFHDTPDQPVSHHQPLNVITNQPASPNNQASLNVKYKTFTPVTPAYSPAVQPTPAFNSPSKHKTRLEMMLEGSASPSAPTNHLKSNSFDGSNSYYQQGVAQQQVSPAPSNQSHSQSAAFSPMATSTLAPRSTFATSSLRRPKDYLNQKRASGGQNAPVSVF